jgi:hypothetical protein
MNVEAFNQVTSPLGGEARIRSNPFHSAREGVAKLRQAANQAAS